MEDGSLSSLTLIVVLVALHALLAMTYAALSANPASYLRDQADDDNRRASRVLRLSDDLPRLHVTAQLVLLLIKVAIFAVATVMVKNPLLGLSPELSTLVVPPLSYIVVLLPLALFIYLLGDLIPSALGRARASGIAPAVALPARVVVVLLGPLSRLLLVMENALMRVAGGSDVATTVTDEEILSLVDVGQRGGAIESEEKEMIRSVLEFGETIVREIMVPRLDVTALEIDATLNDALDAFIDSGHSRVPVYDEKIDNIKGVLYAKDLLNVIRSGELDRRTLAELMRPAHFVPETKRADTLFKEMQARKVHLAIVVDEYGGTAGLVSIEDLVEEIVGDIQDEYDMDEEVEYVQLGLSEYTFDASINLDDFNNLIQADLSTEDNDTLGGFIFGMLGRVPEIGEAIVIDERDSILTLRVDSVEGRRIRKVHVHRENKSSEDEDEVVEEEAEVRHPDPTPKPASL